MAKYPRARTELVGIVCRKVGGADRCSSFASCYGHRPTTEVLYSIKLLLKVHLCTLTRLFRLHRWSFRSSASRVSLGELRLGLPSIMSAPHRPRATPKLRRPGYESSYGYSNRILLVYGSRSVCHHYVATIIFEVNLVFGARGVLCHLEDGRGLQVASPPASLLQNREIDELCSSLVLLRPWHACEYNCCRDLTGTLPRLVGSADEEKPTRGNNIRPTSTVL